MKHRSVVAKLPAAFIAPVFFVLASASPACSAPWLIKDGQAQSEIVISEKPPRMVRLAADELQTYLLRITGAKLLITTVPTAGCPVQIYVGRSPHTDRLGQTDAGLRHGAFRIVSGANFLVLLGHDSDFAPKEPYLNGYSDLPRLMQEWDRLTGEKWGFANGNLYKEFHGGLKIWQRDERGSLNAVYEFLRSLGVRWYLPDELGEVVPKTPSITLPEINKTIEPDFALRFPYQYMRMFGHEGTTREEALWQLRMGWNQAPDLIGDFGMGLSHGMNSVYERPEVRAAHPEYYVLFGGKRDELKVGQSRPCLSSEGLFQQNVKYVRTMFDILDVPLVSVMPQDGYVNLCECDLCRGKGTLERGWTGQISDYVWDYVNRVAREVYKTHPKKKVCCYAYGAYLLPPEKIKTLSPNILVGICQNRNLFHDPVERNKFDELRRAWLEKMPEGHRQLIINDYYLHLRPNASPHLPTFFPRAIARDLHVLKGISIGDFIEAYRDPKGINSLAVDHLNLYVTSRFWWDADQNIDKLLDEYYTEFYGPAREEMKALVNYSEANLMDMGKSAPKIGKALELLEQAQKKVEADSIYGRRLAYIAAYLKPMHDLRGQLAKGREHVPAAAAFERSKADIKIDGKLDDKFWDGLWVNQLSELQTGRSPYMGTSFRVGWAKDAVCFGIRCEDRNTKKLNIGTTRNEDPNIWNGDVVEVLLETQSHSYYQFAVNPAGAIIDLDRQRGLETLWSAGAQVGAYIGDGFWSVEIWIPVVGEQQATIDALHGVAGREPTLTYPWYFNVCRQRVRENDTEASAFSPTGSPSFHVLKKFGSLHVR